MKALFLISVLFTSIFSCYGEDPAGDRYWGALIRKSEVDVGYLLIDTAGEGKVLSFIVSGIDWKELNYFGVLEMAPLAIKVHEVTVGRALHIQRQGVTIKTMNRLPLASRIEGEVGVVMFRSHAPIIPEDDVQLKSKEFMRSLAALVPKTLPILDAPEMP